MSCSIDSFVRIREGTTPQAMVDEVESLLRPKAIEFFAEGSRIQLVYEKGSQWIQVWDLGFIGPASQYNTQLFVFLANELRTEIVMLHGETTWGTATYAHYLDGELRRFLHSSWTDELDNWTWLEILGSPEPWEAIAFQEENGWDYAVGERSPFGEYETRWFLREYYQLDSYCDGMRQRLIDRPLWDTEAEK